MGKVTARTLAVLVCLALLISLGLNGLMLKRYERMYYSVQAVRLDPTGQWEYGGPDSQLPPPSPDNPRVVFFGDSRVLMWQPLPSLEDAEVVNRGISGDTTEQTLLRLDRDVMALSPRIVVIEVGINDLKAIGVMPFREDLITKECQQNIHTMVDKLRGAGIHVVLLTIFPVGSIEWTRRPVWSDKTIAAVDSTNALMKQWTGDNLTVVDCDEVLRTGERIHPRYALDALHINADGYAALNARLTSLLNSLVNPSPKESKSNAIQ